MTCGLKTTNKSRINLINKIQHQPGKVRQSQDYNNIFDSRKSEFRHLDCCSFPMATNDRQSKIVSILFHPLLFS